MGNKKENAVEVVVASDDEEPLTKDVVEKEGAKAIKEVFDATLKPGGITTLRIRGARKNC